MDLGETTLAREREYWDERYRGGEPFAYGWEQFRDAITPAYEPGGAPGGLVHRRAYELLLGSGVEGKRILDYACGLGGLGMHLAQLGADVSAFDLSAEGIENARALAAFNEIPIRFDVADARELPYESGTFDAVIGFSALEHAIKYRGTAIELRRVMKTGAIALFTENLGENPLINLARRFTMRGEEDAGDVLLSRSLVQDWAAPFAEVRVEGYSLLFMAKRVVRNRRLLRFLYDVDRGLLTVAPALRRFGGECVIVLRA